MYHVSSNKKSQNSANSIVEALISLTKNTKVDDMTITKLCSLSNVSRTTFYRLFDNIEDIIQYKIESIFQSIIHTKAKDYEGGFIDTANIFIQNSQFIDLLFDNNKIDLLYLGYKKYRNFYRDNLVHNSNKPSAEAVDFLYYYFLFSTYYRKELGIEKNPEKLYQIYKSTISFFGEKDC